LWGWSEVLRASSFRRRDKWSGGGTPSGPSPLNRFTSTTMPSSTGETWIPDTLRFATRSRMTVAWRLKRIAKVSDWHSHFHRRHSCACHRNPGLDGRVTDAAAEQSRKQLSDLTPPRRRSLTQEAG